MEPIHPFCTGADDDTYARRWWHWEDSGQELDTCPRMIWSTAELVFKRELLYHATCSWLSSPRTSVWSDKCVGVRELSFMYLHMLTLTSKTVKLLYNCTDNSCGKELVVVFFAQVCTLISPVLNIIYPSLLYWMFQWVISCIQTVGKYFYFMMQNLPKTSRK